MKKITIKKLNISYISKKDLFPIIKYRYKNTLMKGPKDPYPYLKRVFNPKLKIDNY